MKIIEKRLLNSFQELILEGYSIRDAKKKLGIYEMVRQQELSEPCKTALIDLTERARIASHITLTCSVQTSPTKLVR